MKIEQIYTGCLAQGAYYIESEGEAVIIDPLREVTPYIKRAEERDSKIKYIFETHFHADFVSGHIDLARETGATIVYGPGAKTKYDIHEAKDGERFKLGNVEFELLHTPGHTMESSCYLLYDEDGKPHAVFTGDTLFIGDVGRPDLAQKAGKITTEDLAGYLYDSLREKLMTLPDDVIVYPGHGAGSACGKKMAEETVSTIGHQIENNYALRRGMTKEEFIKEVTEGLLPPPQYFSENARMNKEGYQPISEVLESGVQALPVQDFESIAAESGALILDVRAKEEYAQGHIPKSITIGLDDNFAPWVGTLVPDLQQPILVVTPKGREEETVTRLARVGYDNTLGYLEGGIPAWESAGKQIDTLKTIDVDQMAKKLEKGGNFTVLDVRRPNEWDEWHFKDAMHIPLDYINDHMNELERDEKYLIHCASGYRATTAASILKARGYTKVEVLHGKATEVRDQMEMEPVT